MSKAINVLVTGANGQLGLTLKDQSKNDTDINWLFYNSSELDITNKEEVSKAFKKNQIDICINCAAYTNVELAEDEKENAFAVNYQGVKNIVDTIKNSKTTLIHISTDYVFDGEKKSAYIEEDTTNPINVYGESKLAGEDYITSTLELFYIFRTSWLYSIYGKNFFTTIKSKILENASLKIVSSQKGSPTSTIDLAKMLCSLIKNDKKPYGIYHFCNTGLANWYIFAKEIITLIDKDKLVCLSETDSYWKHALSELIKSTK